MKTIGEKIKFIRELNNFTQAHVADLLGISQSTYSKWEKNEVNLTLTQIQKIAEIYGKSPQFIQELDLNRILNESDTPDTAEIIRMYQRHIQSLEKERDKLMELLDKLINRLSP
jgi:transcriptional regulator with XRE-family HTH domain